MKKGLKPKSKLTSKSRLDNFELILANLFKEIDAVSNNLADEKRFLNLYKNYKVGDRRIVDFLENSKTRDFPNVEFFNKWMSVGEIYPEPFSRDVNGDQRIVNNRIALKNIEGLRNVISQKRIILDEAINHLTRGEDDNSHENVQVYYFSNDGRVYSDFEKGFSLVQDKNSYKLLRMLIKKSPNYIPTSILVEDLKSTGPSVRETVGSIRRQFEEKFQGVRGKDVIGGKPGSGYRLSGKIKILLDK